MKLRIAPSILSADFGHLNEDIATVDSFADLLHVDIMDGHFVPNITFGPGLVSRLKSKVPLDLHLMIENADQFVEPFAKAVKASVGEGMTRESYIVVHQEVNSNLAGVIQSIRGFGMKAGVAMNPDTELSTVEHVLDDVDMVLCMTVFPGFGGQKFIEDVTTKVKTLREKKPDLDIQVDGGINGETVHQAVVAGANVIVAGSYIFGAEDREAAIASLRV